MPPLLHLAQCCFHLLFSEHKVDAVLLLGLRKMRVSTAEALTTIYKMTPTPHPPFSALILSLSLSPFSCPPPRSLRARKHAGFHFAEKTFCCNCCAVRFSGLQDYRLYPDTPRWTCVPLTLQSLQFCRVIYGVRRTHPPYLLLSTFMNPGVCRGPEKQSYYPSTALCWGDKSALAPFKKGGTEFSFAVVGD